jgi:fructosamine-3-kinase
MGARPAMSGAAMRGPAPDSVLGSAVRRRVGLGGGAARVELADGRTVLLKRSAPTAVAAEAAGLRWLRAPGGPPVPAVLEAGPDFLVTEYVRSATPEPAAAAAFGRRLAVLHAAGAPVFGAGPPGGPAQAWIGRSPMRNTPTRAARSGPAGPSWADWYAADRLLPYLRRARDAGDLTADEAVPVERVCDRLPALAGPAEPPARLHGDLWSGNLIWSADGVWLIDPAAHGGHRETDLAMLALFGCPRLPTVLDAYREAAPLAEGWPARVPLHQLFPLLVHVVIFGRGYAGQATAAARAALRAG